MTRDKKKEKKGAVERADPVFIGIRIQGRISTPTHYQILNVSPEAPVQEIKKKYFQLVKKIHTRTADPSLPHAVRKKMTLDLGHIHRAYAVLNDGIRRRQYDFSHGIRTVLEKGDIHREADLIFREGRYLYDQGKYEQCLVQLAKAVDLWSYDARYYRLLALVERKLPDRRRKAESYFMRAIELEPRNPNGYIALGLHCNEEGLYTKAERQFKRALSIDPSHRLAKSLVGGINRKKKRHSRFCRLLRMGR